MHNNIAATAPRCTSVAMCWRGLVIFIALGVGTGACQFHPSDLAISDDAGMVLKPGPDATTTVDAGVMFGDAFAGMPSPTPMPIVDGGNAPVDAPPDQIATCDPLLCGAHGGQCINEVCTIVCTGDGCSARQIVCPPSLACQVTCGEGACSLVDCTAASSCTVTCSGEGACRGPIACGTGPCMVFCSGEDTCGGGVDCSQACFCDVRCVSGASGCNPSCPSHGCNDVDTCS